MMARLDKKRRSSAEHIRVVVGGAAPRYHLARTSVTATAGRLLAPIRWSGMERAPSERLGLYWYEHPMPEERGESYVKLAGELEIPICSPEIDKGGLSTRAEWILRRASDISRTDVLRGAITGDIKTAALCETFGTSVALSNVTLVTLSESEAFRCHPKYLMALFVCRERGHR